jgi:gamma-glutamyl-gamma-aminobutyrate hydrolase PuuD
LATYPQLPSLLTGIDSLRGQDRERAIERALGVTAPQINEQANAVNSLNIQGVNDLSEDIIALRALAESVEAAVRSGNALSLGLDWGDG